jgi:two-component system, sporulation sensor kinase D
MNFCWIQGYWNRPIDVSLADMAKISLYQNKQRWKWLLVVFAALLVFLTVAYTQVIIDRIKVDEKAKVETWAQSIVRSAKSNQYIDSLLTLMRREEEAKARLMGKALMFLTTADPQTDFTFTFEFLKDNNTIPILLYDKNNRFVQGRNLPKGKENNREFADSLKSVIVKKYKPIEVSGIGMKLYFDDSQLYKETERTLNELNRSFIDDQVVASSLAPIIILDDRTGALLHHARLNDEEVGDSVRLNQIKLANAPIRIVKPDGQPISIFYEDSLVLQQLRYFPIGQLLLVAVFLFISYFIFSTYRRAEQNQVWVGMAKETAHQLGTPLSSLMGWGALLESQNVPAAYIDELNKDVNRLQIITERFSKIGSAAELKEVDIRHTVQESLEYVKKRISSKIHVSAQVPSRTTTIAINEALFGWVIENLVRNAADAMEEEGSIEVLVGSELNKVIIEVKDTGKGIPKANWKTVFKPGYTTKSRGWGLGLSLVKRIVEEYHKGSIFVKQSELGKGTTFRIELKSNQ